MSPKKIAATALAIAALFVAGAFLAQGPVGTELSIEFPEQLRAAASNSASAVIRTRRIAPESVRLEFHVGLKRIFKVLGASIGPLVDETESASEYTIVSADGKDSIRCLVRARGDHLIGIVIEHDASTRYAAVGLRDDLRIAVPDVPILLTEH